MTTFEEAKAARPTATLRVPVGACKEFGHEAISRAIEDNESAVQEETRGAIKQYLTNVRDALMGGSPAIMAPSKANR